MNSKLHIALGTLSITVGGAIYAIYRPHTLLYQLFPSSDHSLLSDLRATPPPLPWFVIYNLPGALWSLAYILIIHGFYAHTPLRQRLVIASIVPLIGAASELMQAAHLLPGHYDTIDLLCYSIPYLAYLAISSL